MANRLVLDMGLHLDSNILNSPNHITEAEAELRRQIYWSLYCDDKLAASYTGRVCTMLVRYPFIPLLPGNDRAVMPIALLSFPRISKE